MPPAQARVPQGQAHVVGAQVLQLGMEVQVEVGVVKVMAVKA